MLGEVAMLADALLEIDGAGVSGRRQRFAVDQNRRTAFDHRDFGIRQPSLDALECLRQH